MPVDDLSESLPYEHRQKGLLTRVSLGGGILVIGATLPFVPPSGPGYGFVVVILVILLVALIVFSSLTITVDHRHVDAIFGLGWPTFRIPVEDITASRTVRNPWYVGWGIRWIRRGTVYNVSGFDAVELDLENGRRVRLGTDDPRGLARAVESARAMAAS